ncbi:hypothetical protein [Winogradskyella bathintestinalis]|uniref:Magnesium citrate secondary transporter n=1 Tax=Winogradskyella bathintestinalis TaxID=3035208 RepID=A0ABT7ZRY4_9FLAO|nr:hypothetical protein [Winogradskyella bathintestinalis]MDN3491748.1 hypothetical protein [Winogradskyella bathintestinalis]
MKILRHPLFYFSVLVALVLYVAQRLELPLPNWITFYVNDFLCMPIVLSLCLALLRIIKQTEKLYVPLAVVLILTIYFSIYFEWWVPKFNPRYTSDIIDVILYILGAALFFKLQKKLF